MALPCNSGELVTLRRMHRRILTVTALALTLSGCRTAAPIPAPPGEVLRQQPPPNEFVVRTKQGREIRLGNVSVRGDSIVGVRSISSGETVTIAIDDVESMGRSEIDAIPTIMVMMVVVGGSILAALYAIGRGFSGT